MTKASFRPSLLRRLPYHALELASQHRQAPYSNLPLDKIDQYPEHSVTTSTLQ